MPVICRGQMYPRARLSAFRDFSERYGRYLSA